MTQTIEQLRWLGNYLADDAESKGIGQGSEGARYCFAGAKTIEQLQARVAELEAAHAAVVLNNQQLREALCGEVVTTLLRMAGVVENAFDGNEEGEYLTISNSQAVALSEYLSTLEALPDDKPGFTLSGRGRAEWCLTKAISTPISTEALDKYVAEKVRLIANS